MAANTTHDDAFALAYKGTPTTDIQRAKALAAGGPLSLKSEHVLLGMLPDVWEKDATGGVTTSLPTIHGLVAVEHMIAYVRSRRVDM